MFVGICGGTILSDCANVIRCAGLHLVPALGEVHRRYDGAPSSIGDRGSEVIFLGEVDRRHDGPPSSIGEGR